MFSKTNGERITEKLKRDSIRKQIMIRKSKRGNNAKYFRKQKELEKVKKGRYHK